jgi:hypothetical protein
LIFTPFGVVHMLLSKSTFVCLKNCFSYRLLLSLAMFQICIIQAQNLENAKNIKEIKNKKPFEYGGSIGLGFGYYNSNAAIKRLAPYNWFVSGSPFIRLYGITIPFSFTYSETGRSLTHPFRYNFTGASPYYKWATTHLGFRSMNFGEYTVSGVVFNGIGVELKPKKFRLGAFYGVFNPAVEPDSSNDNFGVVLPAYKRIGYGAKLGYGTDRNYFDLIYFRGKDLPNSLNKAPEFDVIKPVDNVSFGPRFKFTFFKRWYIESDVAVSVLTRNVLNDTLKETKDIKTIYQFVRVNTTTYGAFAGHVATGLIFKKWSINTRLRQISSDYQSLGINLLQDDIREITVNPNISFFKGKMSLSSSLGMYTDNISQKRVNTTVRKILNGNINLSPSRKFNINLGYSNFGTSRTNGIVQMNDSITFSIINESYQSNISFNTGNKKRALGINLFGMFQKADDRNIFTRKYNNSEVLNLGLNGQYKFVESKTSITSGISYANFSVAEQTYRTQNLQLGMRKNVFKDKMNIGLTGNYSKRFNESVLQGDVASINLNLQTQIAKKHSIQTQMRLMRNTTGIISNTAFNEQRFFIQYGFAF